MIAFRMCAGGIDLLSPRRCRFGCCTSHKFVFGCFNVTNAAVAAAGICMLYIVTVYSRSLRLPALTGQLGMDHQARASNTLGDYYLIRELGHSNLSRYLLAAHQVRQTMHIVRVLHKGILDRIEEVRDLFYSELVALRALNHPSVASLTDILEDARCAYIITEFINAPRFMKLCLNREMVHPLSNFENVARRNFHQLVNIALFLDRWEVPHWFRLENVVQTSAEKLVLMLFSTPEDNNVESGSPNHGFVCPGHYRAPEPEGKNLYTSAGNAWACGVALYVLLTGKLTIPTNIWSGAQELPRLLLEWNSAMHVHLRDVPSHPWFAGGILGTDDKSILLEGTWSDLFAVTRSNVYKRALETHHLEQTEHKWPDAFEISLPLDQSSSTRASKTVTFEHQLPSSLRSKRPTRNVAEMNELSAFSDAEMMRSVLLEIEEEAGLKTQSSMRSSKRERRRDSSTRSCKRMSWRLSETVSEQLGRNHWWSGVRFRLPSTIRLMTS